MTKRTPILVVLMAILLLPLFSLAQKPITGRVVSSTDQTPIPGATIIVKGLKTGTSTGVDGSFSIKAKEGEVLVITGVGVTRQEFIVGKDNDVTITVVASAKDLNEVVVTALGIKKKPSD